MGFPIRTREVYGMRISATETAVQQFLGNKATGLAADCVIVAHRQHTSPDSPGRWDYVYETGRRGGSATQRVRTWEIHGLKGYVHVQPDAMDGVKLDVPLGRLRAAELSIPRCNVSVNGNPVGVPDMPETYQRFMDASLPATEEVNRGILWEFPDQALLLMKDPEEAVYTGGLALKHFDL